MMYRAVILSIAFAVAVPVKVPAQFTTFIAEPTARIDSAKAAIVAQTKARADSVARVALSEMRAWVDSAAGVTTTIRTDSVPVATPNEAETSLPEPPAPTTTTSFSNGAVAPDTASALPLITILGLASLSLGIVILAGRAGRRRGRV